MIAVLSRVRITESKPRTRFHRIKPLIPSETEQRFAWGGVDQSRQLASKFSQFESEFQQVRGVRFQNGRSATRVPDAGIYQQPMPTLPEWLSVRDRGGSRSLLVHESSAGPSRDQRPRMSVPKLSRCRHSKRSNQCASTDKTGSQQLSRRLKKGHSSRQAVESDLRAPAR